ncbi:hypothetical protein PC116_g14675 [Phytophthora cactorum]|uniref:Uncharacterized protein n=1 Tax=Phytophthora cactorum TaxID=29920 RepID=A0A8T1CAA9_9STRA|nr:hypothetical protein PC111_g9553 [Phytophthora cactorum]KAG2856609.1 hypothetical protein PC113_g11425 [Phytophthora cactorum]KAG2904572.1 hypothetical protein PC114_g11819 [Phytophthora cactorum]KAG2919342.1 hypothetical protein PC115_g10185 [Phytophthora cactorum]KAG2937695.1 hypothetical protein PC117_g11584 [Phytophthora cactorum]
MALAGVYPLYKVLYDLTPVNFRGGALIALPLWKFAAKHFIMWSARELEDFVPAIVALSVDLFSVLFLSVCISTSGSLYLSLLFIATDVGQTLLEFREVLATSTTVLEILRIQKSSLQEKDSNREDESMKLNLLTSITTVTRNPSAFRVTSLKRTRLWACLPHRMTVDQAKQMDVLEDSGLYGPRGLLSSRKSSRSRRKSQHRSLSFGPLKRTSIVPGFASSSNKVIKQGDKSRQLVVQGLQLLFHCEYLALVEYIECVVPLLFATYKLVLHQLPNIAYYPASNNWGVAAIANILMYQVQAHLFLEIVILLQYELAHLGADFTFQFEWLHSSV